MEKKEIQEARIKNYFIGSAKSLIRGEGVKVVSVRRVADEAGYSYATLYNYFKNLSDLLAACVNDFLEECRQFILADKHPAAPGPDRIKSMTRSYVRYFIQYPGTFELMFLERMPELHHNESIGRAIYVFLENLLEEDWSACVRAGVVAESKLDELRELFRSSVHGSMLFYLNRRIPKDYSEFMKNIDGMIDSIFPR